MYTSAACIFNNVPDTVNITSHHALEGNLVLCRHSQRSAFILSFIACFASNSRFLVFQ